MDIVNLISYVQRNALCYHGIHDYPTIRLWLYLEKVGDRKYRITHHAWQSSEMYWDATGIRPLMIGAYARRADVLKALEEEVVTGEEFGRYN